MSAKQAIVAPCGRLFSFRQALAYLGMEESRLRRLVAARKIPVHRDGRLGFWERDLDDWMLAHRSPEAHPPKATLTRTMARPPVVVDDFADLLPARRRLS